MSDAFGGHGGISVYNIDYIQSLSAKENIKSILVIPRTIVNKDYVVPKNVNFVSGAAKSVRSYLSYLAVSIPWIARADLIYCGHLNLAPIARGLGSIFRVPVLGALYGIDAWTPFRNPIRRSAAAKLDFYFAISRYTKDRFIEWSGVPGERIDLLPNAIHLENYRIGQPSQVLARRLGVEGRKVILTFGRLVSRERAKGFDEVLEVLPQITAKMPEIVYVIAGAGPYRDELVARVRELDLQDRVVFTGMVREEEKADIYRLADIYVMPSRGEGFGFVFLEAMACGVPVIASSVDGSREAVMDGRLGVMVDPDDKQGLAAAILEGLQKEKQIPPGLEYFNYPNFTARAHAIVERAVDWQIGR